MKENRLLIVDDHEMFRSGLNFILKDIEGIKVVGEASNGLDLLDILEDEKVDIILMDINMPEMNGIEATREVLARDPKIKIIVISMHAEEVYYDQMLDAGVKGFLLKNSGVEELKIALQAVINGGTYFSQELLVTILDKKKSSESSSALIKFHIEKWKY